MSEMSALKKANDIAAMLSKSINDENPKKRNLDDNSINNPNIKRSKKEEEKYFETSKKEQL